MSIQLNKNIDEETIKAMIRLQDKEPEAFEKVIKYFEFHGAYFSALACTIPDDLASKRYQGAASTARLFAETLVGAPELLRKHREKEKKKTKQ